MGCPSSIMKCLLNMLNSMMALFGVALIALATLSLKSAPQVYVYYLYIIGGIMFIAALLGCCGICQEDVCMTTTYAIIILVSLIAQVCGKIYASDSQAIRDFARKDVEKTWLEEIQHPGAMDKTQQTYECCGKRSAQDYHQIGRLEYPLSCYPHSMRNATALFNDGCIQKAEEAFIGIFNYSSKTEWGAIVFTAIMFVFALYLIMRFRNKQRYSY